MVQDAIEYNAIDPEDPEQVVPVMLRLVHRPRGLRVDDLGSSDVISGKSWFTRAIVPPDELLFWDPRRKDWRPVADWDEPDPMLGVKSVEYYDEDGDVVSAQVHWTSRGIYTIGPYDQGGFKPPKR